MIRLKNSRRPSSPTSRQRTVPVIEVWHDGGGAEHSCGESRTDWTLICVVPRSTFLHAVYRLITGASDREDVA